jgi:hypothetical protein
VKDERIFTDSDVVAVFDLTRRFTNDLLAVHQHAISAAPIIDKIAILIPFEQRVMARREGIQIQQDIA